MLEKDINNNDNGKDKILSKASVDEAVDDGNRGVANMKTMLGNQKIMEEELAKEYAKEISDLRVSLELERKKFEESLEKIKEERIEDAEKIAKEKISDAEHNVAQMIAEANNEISEKKKLAEKEIQAQKEKIISDANNDVIRMTKDINDREQALEKNEADIKERSEKLAEKVNEIEERENKVESEKRRIEYRKEQLSDRESDIDALAEDIAKDRIQNLIAQISAKDDALKEARNKISKLISDYNEIETFKVSLGEDPSAIESRIADLQRTIDNLKEELANRSSKEAEIELDNYKAENKMLLDQIEDLRKSNSLLQHENGRLEALEIENDKLKNVNEEKESELVEIKGQNENYIARIKRLSTPDSAFSDRESRIAEINNGYLDELIGKPTDDNLDEMEWLNNINQECDKYQIEFPDRILKSFHTSLKISDWSTLTVLAGVSGTGKSELPKLYSAFGGLNFINVPVQPSWDSQESMLGFYNSIDNRFEPEPLLRFLVQCTENPDYNKYMSLVLLDEMNLAHVEYYFADFLSKLESRRGRSSDNIPAVEVKLGAGVAPYELKLKRSLLWTGTMNQDETTKSLSDKVLDRGVVINFPRPHELKDRIGMKSLDNYLRDPNRQLLTEQTWRKWVVKTALMKNESDQQKEMTKYRRIIEKINDELENVGRAVGHRVWQSIEHYIVNYPTVERIRRELSSNGEDGELPGSLEKEMNKAFEDQIVQKIMPKLRGVEIRGKSKAHLDTIKSIIVNNGFEDLEEDFEVACDQGYGQFIWSSAKYIERDESSKKATMDSDIENPQ